MSLMEPVPGQGMPERCSFPQVAGYPVRQLAFIETSTAAELGEQRLCFVFLMILLYSFSVDESFPLARKRQIIPVLSRGGDYLTSFFLIIE